MSKTVLLTGGAGFIGHHSCEYILKNTDWNIIILDRLSYAGNLNKLMDIDVFQSALLKERVKFYYHDFRSSFSENKIVDILSIFHGINYIIHMGAESHVDRSITDPYPFVESNVLGTVNMLELAKALPKYPSSFEKMIYVSTDEVYGPAHDGHLHKEGEAHAPSNPYSASKAAGEDFCIAYHNTYGVPVIISRTMNNIGERQDSEKFFPMVVKNILANEPVTIHCRKELDAVVEISSRCWLHAQNHASALVFLLENGDLGEAYNVTGEWLPVDDLAIQISEVIDRVVGETLELNLEYEDFHSFRQGHDLHYGLDGTKIAELGWKAPVSLEESLKKTVEWMLDNPEWL